MWYAHILVVSVVECIAMPSCVAAWEQHCDCPDAACTRDVCAPGGRVGIAWVEHWGPRIAPAADVLPCALQDKYTPLHWAALNGETDTVEALLRHKANIEAKNKVSDTLQHALPEGSESRG